MNKTYWYSIIMDESLTDSEIRPLWKKAISAHFRHVLRPNKIRIGKISKRPANMSKIMTSFERSLNKEKFPDGPTMAKPGPILLIVANTALKLVSKEKPSRDKNKKLMTTIAR